WLKGEAAGQKGRIEGNPVEGQTTVLSLYDVLHTTSPQVSSYHIFHLPTCLSISHVMHAARKDHHGHEARYEECGAGPAAPGAAVPGP
ncbi:hypothetical protein HaLaN_07590, partial [Haematococcus lacustris]